MPDGRRGRRVWAAAVLLTFWAHFLWELSQAGFFSNMAGMPFARHALVCLAASLGDLLIAAAAYALAALVFRRPAWALRPGWWAPAALWLAAGLAVTVLIERWAVATGRWAYGPAMPTLLGVGLLPVLQWIIVPASTLGIVRAVSARPVARVGGRD